MHVPEAELQSDNGIFQEPRYKIAAIKILLPGEIISVPQYQLDRQRLQDEIAL